MIEEASYYGKYHEPCLQLLELADGSQSIRFCYYSRGRFQRAPLMIPKDELKKLQRALKKAPRLQRLLKPLIKV